MTRNRDDDVGARQIRVLLIDDHPVIHIALGNVIESKMGIQLVGTATMADEGLEMARELEPDVAIVDISLSDAHGLDLVKNLKVQVPDIQVVVFSMYDEHVYAERALRAGASAYLMKSEPMNNVVEAIQNVSRGDVYLSKHMASRILGKVALGHTSKPMFAVDELTDREMAVFQMLGEGFGLEAITEKLNLSRKTVETYRRRAKEKLGLRSIEELLQYAIEWTHSQSQVEDR